MFRLNLAAILIILATSFAISFQNDLETIMKINSDPKKGWKAKAYENLVFPPNLMKAVADDRDIDVITSSNLPRTSIPVSFDAETAWPNCKFAVRSQGQCGSCWAFVKLSFFSQYLLKSNHRRLIPDLLQRWFFKPECASKESFQTHGFFLLKNLSVAIVQTRFI